MNSDKMIFLFCQYICISFLFGLTLCNDFSGSCFCKLEGKIDDCSCSVDTVDYFNNVKIYPRLKSLLVTDYFRYIKVNLNHNCPFWPDDSRCVIKDCSVKTCSEDSLPPGLKGNYNSVHKNEAKKYLKEASEEDSCDENYKGLGAINETLSKENYEDFQRWQEHDDSESNFCVMDDESSSDSQYVDLLLNPERYTGYKGFSAHRIWNSIYKENCFKFGVGYGPYTTSKNLDAMCLEKRTFYRAISGMHTSITTHLCSQYYTEGRTSFSLGQWGPNIQEFQKRFDPLRTNGEGTHWLRNLYFIYLLELRALAKAAPYFKRELFYTGNNELDTEVKEAVNEIVNLAKSFPDHFNEGVMFAGDDSSTKKLKEEFRQHFLNISMIMNCVGCDKCRLWGKIQVQGLGTAFKILFSENVLTGKATPKFQLTRSEIVSLWNAFGRLSNSVYQLESFRKKLNNEPIL